MLRHCWVLCSLCALVMARECAAQEEPRETRDDVPRATTMQETLTTMTRTPEMWLYEQERIRYEDPKQAVRRRAEMRAAQRSDRLAAQRWYGISNSRPMATCTPHMEGYSPYWGSNTYDPNRWRAFSLPEASTAYVVPVPVRY
jgi:hypothetical protein